MKHLTRTLVLSLCLVPQAFALETDPAQHKPADSEHPTSDLSSELELFVNGAISEGLLTPATPDHQTSTRIQDEHASALPAPDSGHTPVAEITKSDDSALRSACAAPYALDFTDLQKFSRYQELYEFQQSERGGDAKGLRLAKVYISLGLYSEAVMVMKTTDGPEKPAFLKLAALLEHRQRADLPYFRELASCHPEAGLWLSVAELMSGNEAGIRLIESHLTDYRALPLQLRTEVAVRTIPELDKRGERTLARKLVADFTEDEIGNSSELQFVKALVDLGEGNLQAEKTIKGFLSHPQFQEQVLDLMLRRDQPVDAIYQDVLLNELMDKFGQSQNDAELAASLQFALKELTDGSRYEPIMQLAAAPALQNPTAQSTVKREFFASLERDLGSEDSLRTLAAIEALSAGSRLLDDEPKRDEIYNAAASAAVRFGFVSLAVKLAGQSDMDVSVAEDIADLAFRRHDRADVYRLARAHPESSRLNLLAALSALSDEEQPSVVEFERYLDDQPETVLALIEQDAATGQWLVSDRFYEAASRLTGDEHKSRVARVMSLRSAIGTNFDPNLPVSMSRVPDILNRVSLPTDANGKMN